MGIYINPTTDRTARDKWDTIMKAGVVVDRNTYQSHQPGDKDMWGVCLVDAGMHIAAGVAYSKAEAEVHADIRDTRNKEFLFLTLDKIGQLDPSVPSQLLKHKG